MLRYNPGVVLLVALTSLVFEYTSSRESCQKSSDFREDDDVPRDEVQILLHTRPSNLLNDFAIADEHNHRWALVFLFPDIQRILTHEGIVSDDKGIGCSYDGSPPDAYGSTIRFLGIVSGSPKKFSDLAKIIETKLSLRMRMTFYSHNWVMTMLRTVEGELWNRFKDSETFFATVQNLYSSGNGNDYGSLRNLSEVYLRSLNKRNRTMTWGDFKCLFSLAVYAVEATLVPYMLKQGPLILLAYSFAIDFQASTTYEHISRTVDVMNPTELMKAWVKIARFLFAGLHWVLGVFHTVLLVRFTVTLPKIFILIVMCSI